ncbi:MAG TPA: sulfite exporter TauE/SafE family protein [Nitrospirota bacterium]|nr:sulfite exporter TauE/SafE family protein [Nitrospirota bacterium]
MNLLIGLLAGLFGGITGGGGGIVSIPLMVAFLKLDQHAAHGISLVALVFTGLVGAITYAIHGTLDVTASILMALTAVAAARAGAHFAHSLPEWKLKRSFGGYLILVAGLMLSKPFLPALHTPAAVRIAVLLLTGALAGFTSGMMGVGGGAIMIPAMVLLAGFDQHYAQGSSLLVMVPTGMTGAYTHWKLGNMRTEVLPGLIGGILIGTFLGGTVAHFLSDAALRFIFAALLIVTGVRYLKTRRPALREAASR